MLEAVGYIDLNRSLSALNSAHDRENEQSSKAWKARDPSL